jgi:fumarate reductase subunit D
MARSRRLRLEPALWLLFSAGGMASALVMPVVVLFGVCALSLFHWAHRFKYTLYDGLQVKHLNEMLNAFCYGGAVIGTIVSAYVLWRL